tara:strand:+ start:2621 stop:3133 length:513 start_codon:yes stop_codon:yes gene_type:complete
MLRADFFYRVFKYKNNNSNQIIKYRSNEEFALEEQIKNKIIEIDEQISENSKALIQAQMVKLKSTFSKSNNFIEKIGQNVYKKKLDDSINWHQKQLKELYFNRRDLQIKIEKIKGIYWLNRIKRLLTIILIGFFILLSLFIFLSGFMIIIYLLPLILLIFIGYVVTTKKY